MDNKDKSKICIMIVPHTKKVKNIVIPQWLPKTSLGLLLTLFIALSLYVRRTTTYKLSLKAETEDKSSIINHLEEEGKVKNAELDDLKSHTDELEKKTEIVNEKLLEIEKLQRKLEKMAGIDSPSRGGNTGIDISLKNLNLESKMDILSEVLDDKKLELENFIEDLEIQFEYLKSVPDLRPTSGRLSSKFGNRRNPFGSGIRFHQGIDIANSRGTNILAAAKGTVTFAGYKGGYGKTIIINHGHGFTTLYAHNSSLLVNVGDKVDKGDIISKMGNTGRSTGNHLHFEIHKSNKPIDPISIINN